MKKKVLLLAIPLLLLLVACNMANTPTSKVEALFSKYQKLDEDISNGIEDIIEDEDLSDSRKERYKKILENQYKNLTYQIKDEIIDGDNATVTAEIEVTDLKKTISDLIYDTSIYTTKDLYDEEKLNRLENAKDKVKYTIEFSLTKKENGEWNLNTLSDLELQKIQGMY